jgi:Tol biopolymer transport system component
MNADGTGQNKITSNANAQLTYSTPFISPDGNKIVYTSTRARLVNNTSYISTLTDVYTCNIDGSNEARITNSVPQSDFWFNANWDKDSKRVLLIHHGIRIPYTLYIFNTADNTGKLATATWIKPGADIKQF